MVVAERLLDHPRRLGQDFFEIEIGGHPRAELRDNPEELGALLLLLKESRVLDGDADLLRERLQYHLVGLVESVGAPALRVQNAECLASRRDGHGYR